MKYTLLWSFLLAFSFAQAQEWKTYSDSANLLSKQREYESAVVYFTKAKTLLQAANRLSDDYVQLCTAFGVVYASTGDAGAAAPLFSEAKDIAEQLHGKMDKAYARATTFLANIYSMLGRYPQAEAFYLEAKDIREKLYGKKETEEYAQTCNNLAELYRTMGAFEKAEPLSIEAREIRRLVWTAKHPSYAISTTALANLYRDMGQYEKAEPLYQEARQIRLDTFGRVHPDYAASCNILADLYFYMSRYAEAENLYHEAKDIRKELYKTTLNANYAQSCNNLASLYLLTGRFAEAEKLALQASNIWQQTLPDGHENHAIGFANLGNIYFELGQFTKAQRYYQQARQTWAASLGKVHFNYISYTINLAKVYWNQQKTAVAQQLFREAIALQKKQIDQFFTFTNEREKEAFLDNVLNAGNEYYSFLFRAPKQDGSGLAYDLSLLKRNLILNSLQQLLLFAEREEAPETQKLYAAWRSVKAELATALAEESLPATETKALEEKASQLEKELVKASAPFRSRQAQAVHSYKDIRQRLGTTEAAIEFIRFDEFDGRQWTGKTRYAALVLRKDRAVPVAVPLFEEAQLLAALEKSGVGVVTGNRGGGVENTSADAAALANLLANPLLPHLKGIRRIYYSPAGLLHRVSFAALPLGREQVLSDRFELVHLATTATAGDKGQQTLTAADSLVFYGGVDYSASNGEGNLAPGKKNSGVATRLALPANGVAGKAWLPLPGTAAELTAIEAQSREKAFHIKLYRDRDATEESIKQVTAKQAPAVLHIATHGFFFPDPQQDKTKSLPGAAGGVFRQAANPLLRSGLLLAGANQTWQGRRLSAAEDGILTAYEVSNLALPYTKLVVLSACETALGDIQGTEGVYGLQRAFKMAGANYLLMSLWKVPDAETAEFMEQFYQHLFNGQPINAAFAAAQKTMKAKYRNEPVKWAAWVLVR